MAPVDLSILQILINCGCTQHAMKFAGLTMEKLFLYTRDDLTRILSALEGSQDLVQKIEEEIRKAKSQQQIGQNDEDDDDLRILEVITKTGGTLVTVKEEIVDDDDDDGGGGQQNNGQLALMDQQVNLNNDDGGGSNSIEPDDRSSEDVDYEKEPIELDPRSPRRKGFQELEADKRAAVIIAGSKEHSCEKDHPTNIILNQWTYSLKRWGSHIRSLRMSTWTWKVPTSCCPWNLFKILTQQCLFISELSIEIINNNFSDDKVPQFPPNFRLSNLKILRIHHKWDLAYSNQLKQILVAANKIQQIYFFYGSLEAVNSLLKILQDLPKGQLQSLKILSIKSHNGSGYLTKTQVVMLTKVEAVSLEELELGDGLWGDVQGYTMERMLRRFSSTLQTLTILGGYQGRSDLTPKILITVPHMTNLKCLKIGSNCVYDEIFEDSLPLNPPPKKIQKGSTGQRVISTNSCIKVEPFTVSLQFLLLPNLKELRLGHLFNINDLHFSSFPKLETFFVSSRWDLSVIFPPIETSRRACYPLVTQLKLPDCLDDPNFIKLIPSRFPNVKFCRILLPTVKVMRTFFSAMADSNLEELKLSTRFDFQCTLDTCLQDKPSEVSLVLSEVEKICLLKEYEHWEEFLQFHRIQLPEDNLSSLEEEGLAGISSLKKLTTLTLEHCGRTLRIPKGQLHWTDPQCEFTGEFIGFAVYPWSYSCEILRNDLMKKNLQQDFYWYYKIPFRTANEPELLMENPFFVHSSTSEVLLKVKKEEVHENVGLPLKM